MFSAMVNCAPFVADGQFILKLFMATVVTLSFNLGVMVATSQFNPALTKTLISPFNQLLIDCLLWAAYVYMSGGSSNPLISMFLPIVAIAALILKPLQAWFITTLCVFLYALLWKVYQPIPLIAPEMMAHMHLLGMLIVFIVSTISITTFIILLKEAIERSNKALQDAKEQAMRSDWLISLGGLAAGAAHDLSTPLASINLLVDELIAQKQEEQQQKQTKVLVSNAADSEQELNDLKLIQSQVAVCNHALNELTQKAGSPRQDNAHTLVFGTWLTQVVRQWQLLYPNVSIRSAVADSLANTVLHIPLCLERTLINLLNNALKANAEHIVVNALLNDNHDVQITIDDDGLGISNQALQAFDHDEPTQSDMGLGVGLLITKTTIERLGGYMRISKKQAPTHGTCVQYNIPLKSLLATS